VMWDENPVSGATVSIPGTITTTTSASDGSFTLLVNPAQYGVLKLSKTNYVDTYFTWRVEEEFFIIPLDVYNAFLSSFGKSHISGKGDIIGELETINANPVAGAKIVIYNRNGTRLNPDILYFNEDNNPDTTLSETSSSSQFFVLNLDPGYYFITAEKSGFEFSRNLVIVFANGITGSSTIVSYPPLPGIVKQKFEDIPSSNISSGAENVRMLSFILNLKYETNENVVFDSVIVTAKGTGNISTALSSAKLYLDSDNNGTYETLVSTGVISGNKITFSNINKEIYFGINQKYLVVFNFNGTASIGQTFGVDILKNSDVYAHAKDSSLPVTCEGDPITGNLMTIVQAYPPVTPQAIAPQSPVSPVSYLLQSSQFNPGQGSTIHSASQWRMWKDGESIEALTWDSGEDTMNLTNYNTPVLLEGNTTYWFQVRHKNGDNVWSQWSNATSFTTEAGGITPPQKPQNQSPIDGAQDVSQPVTLTSSAFVPGTHTQHVASQWQVFLATKNGEPVFDTKRDTSHLTSITLPSLPGNTQYSWRVRYQDGYGAWSQWSDFTSFSTRQGTKGDINGDSQIDISDVILCLRMAIGLSVTIADQTYQSPYPDWLIYLANMDDNVQVDITDVIKILRRAIVLLD
ncbi:MAG: hypothetical protein ACP5JO_08585, partial [Candidatus Ratteibacteria bacterium]